MINQYHSLGYNPKTQQVTYLFVNPFRNYDNMDNEIFADMIRPINVVVTDGRVNEEATLKHVEEVAHGVYNKMKIRANSYVPESEDQVAIAIFGELVTPASEEPSEE